MIQLSTLGIGMVLYDTVGSGELAGSVCGEGRLLDSLMCTRDFSENFTRPSCNLTHEKVIPHGEMFLHEPTVNCSYIQNDGNSTPEGIRTSQKEGD